MTVVAPFARPPAPLPVTESEMDCGCANPAGLPLAPQPSTAMDAPELGAAHLTHALAEKATLPPVTKSEDMPAPAEAR